jgi:hypothetical protein|tara:strand:- start:102 stop:329 length:228 start_codon:yes stop_codon:yes gene_type:complete
MNKSIFYNKIFAESNSSSQKIFKENSINQSKNVDINKLLNRIKLNKHEELKKKIIFIFGSSTILVLFTFLIISIK